MDLVSKAERAFLTYRAYHVRRLQENLSEDGSEFHDCTHVVELASGYTADLKFENDRLVAFVYNPPDAPSEPCREIAVFLLGGAAIELEPNKYAREG